MNVMQFMAIFLLILVAFALGLSEIFWFYGTDKGIKEMCPDKDSREQCEDEYAFGGIWKNMVSLFWSLFGVVEQGNFKPPGGMHQLTEIVGLMLFAVYNVLAIIVLINMLIAMMSKSYEETSDNEETVWKFQQTRLWIRVIRKEQVRPPPMNLFPNMYWVYKRCSQTFNPKKEEIEMKAVTVEGKGASGSNQMPQVPVNKQLRILRKLARRYRYKILTRRGNFPKSSI